MSKDVFSEVPEYLAAFTNVENKGFFEKIEFRVDSFEGRPFGCLIKATGCIPNDSQYAMDGCGAIMDPATIVANCRKLAAEQVVKGVTTKVETNDWPLYSDNEEDVVGSKGKRVTMFFYTTFAT